MKSIKRRRGNSLRTHNRRIRDVINYFNRESDNESNASDIEPENINKVFPVLPANEDNFAIAEQNESCSLHMKDNEHDKFEMQSFCEIHQPDTEPIRNGLNEYVLQKSESSLLEDLRIWSLETHVPNSSVDLLLKILRRHGHDELPATARTLKRTPKKIISRIMAPGRFWYFGISSVLDILVQENVPLPNNLTLNANIDGVPLFKGSKAVLWPVQVSFSEFNRVRPFAIAIYSCENGSKPDDINDYLSEFVDEASELLNNGYEGTTFKLGSLPLDAPALAYVKNTKSHNSEKACHKCEVTGTSVSGRMCYPQVNNLTKRTDEKFRLRDDPLHHRDLSKTPLERLPINMIDNFNLDYLHVALLGVTKKILKILVKKFKFPISSILRRKLNMTNFAAINQITEMARTTQPMEIQRAIRTLDFFSVMKGKEFRTFIIYYGVVALRNNVHKDIYESFLTLHIALTICLSNEHKHLLNVAQLCFEKFVRDFIRLYGRCMVSYNVHNLLHLVDEVRRCGPLDNFSTFPYENMIGHLKDLPNSGHMPLEQVAKRYLEGIHLDVKQIKDGMDRESKD